MLSQIDVQNEMSYPGLKPSCSALFDINQVSNNSPVELDNDMVKDEDTLDENVIRAMSCHKKHQEDDICLRFASNQRISFA